MGLKKQRDLAEWARAESFAPEFLNFLDIKEEEGLEAMEFRAIIRIDSEI